LATGFVVPFIDGAAGKLLVCIVCLVTNSPGCVCPITDGAARGTLLVGCVCLITDGAAGLDAGCVCLITDGAAALLVGCLIFPTDGASVLHLAVSASFEDFSCTEREVERSAEEGVELRAYLLTLVDADAGAEASTYLFNAGAVS
jgi:hypothetical protein